MDVCSHVLETVCDTLDEVISKMKAKKRGSGVCVCVCVCVWGGGGGGGLSVKRVWLNYHESKSV